MNSESKYFLLFFSSFVCKNVVCDYQKLLFAANLSLNCILFWFQFLQAILIDISKGKITSSGVSYSSFRKGRPTGNAAGNLSLASLTYFKLHPFFPSIVKMLWFLL